MAMLTKFSEKTEVAPSGMKRGSSSGKPRFDLMVPDNLPYRDQMLVRFAELLARGAEHYGERNWEKATGDQELKRFREAAIRHFFQWFMGETDEDHAAAVLFNVMGAEYVKSNAARYKGILVGHYGPTDDTPIKSPYWKVEVAPDGSRWVGMGAKFDTRLDAIAYVSSQQRLRIDLRQSPVNFRVTKVAVDEQGKEFPCGPPQSF